MGTKLEGVRYRAASAVLLADSNWNTAGSYCLWWKWILATRHISKYHVLVHDTCTWTCTWYSVPWYTIKQNSALLHITVLIYTVEKPSYGKVVHRHLLVCYVSRTTVWSKWMRKWSFCLLKVYKSLSPLSCIKTKPHIKWLTLNYLKHHSVTTLNRISCLHLWIKLSSEDSNP